MNKAISSDISQNRMGQAVLSKDNILCISTLDVLIILQNLYEHHFLEL